MFVMEQCETFLVIAHRTAHVCQGNRVLVEIKLFTSLELQISVSSTRLKLSDYGILPSLSAI